MIELPSGERLAVMISWEVFFGGRARDGVTHGGTLLLNPTNGSSYTGTILQTQQIASSRLRALETGRWEAQVAPTGFSAFVTADGEVLDRTGISEQAVPIRTVELRDGRTIYSRLGEKPFVAAAVAVLVLGMVLARRDSRRAGCREDRGDDPPNTGQPPAGPSVSEEPALGAEIGDMDT